MTCPSEIAEILLDILRHGLLAIRAKGWDDDANGCALIADHLHNVPTLLHNFSTDLLKFYWEVERPSFLSQSPLASSLFEKQWQKLSGFIQGQPALAK